jgi:2-iminobutanoate/2-iminopropanoate deaminase
MRKQIFTEKGVNTPAPYSQAIVAQGPMVFISGQGSFDPKTNTFAPGDFRHQATLTFDNVTTLLEAAGTSWEQVVKVGVFLADLNDFADMNKIYRQYVKEPYPARTTVQSGLAGQMLIEVDCIAVVPE